MYDKRTFDLPILPPSPGASKSAYAHDMRRPISFDASSSVLPWKRRLNPWWHTMTNFKQPNETYPHPDAVHRGSALSARAKGGGCWFLPASIFEQSCGMIIGSDISGIRSHHLLCSLFALGHSHSLQWYYIGPQCKVHALTLGSPADQIRHTRPPHNMLLVRNN
jgi:hypothetical protein